MSGVVNGKRINLVRRGLPSFGNPQAKEGRGGTAHRDVRADHSAGAGPGGAEVGPVRRRAGRPQLIGAAQHCEARVAIDGGVGRYDDVSGNGEVQLIGNWFWAARLYSALRG